MRFARHAKIFRGPLDPAPVAGVWLLLNAEQAAIYAHRYEDAWTAFQAS